LLKAIPPSTTPILEDAYFPALNNGAVALCACAREKVYQAVLAKTKHEYYAERDAAKAYRQAMPPLSGYECICDYIACVSYGVLIGAIMERTASKLLYAAQVALATVPDRSKTRTRRDA
jgi:hypothetical protein